MGELEGRYHSRRVTLRFADQVGEILSEMPEGMEPPADDHYYM